MGEKAKIEVPVNHGSQYLDNMVPPSEMGLCAFGHRGLHENIQRATTFSAQMLDPFPRVMTKYQNINKEIQNAKEQGHFWKMDHLQAALANEGLMTHEERTLVQHGGDTHHNIQPKMTSTKVPRKRAHSRWSWLANFARRHATAHTALTYANIKTLEPSRAQDADAFLHRPTRARLNTWAWERGNRYKISNHLSPVLSRAQLQAI